MQFPIIRPRRLRVNNGIRSIVAETKLSLENLIMPFFVVDGSKIVEPIASMPNMFHYSVDTLVQEVKDIYNMGIRSVLFFGVPQKKDEKGSEALRADGIVQRAVQEIKAKVPEMVVITDVCLCAYTSHGHCGIVDEKGRVINDVSLTHISKMALSHAKSGADIVAPSDMMDGRVSAIRSVLDNDGYEDTAILSYAVKYASCFYGPFRDAVGSAPAFGDRKTYQMDISNVREAVKEICLDVNEGADFIMIKPALPYLDVISKARSRCDLPIVAYQVSGEYSMICASAEKGWIDKDKAMIETLTSIKRAGADLIITYFTKRYAEVVNSYSSRKTK